MLVRNLMRGAILVILAGALSSCGTFGRRAATADPGAVDARAAAAQQRGTDETAVTINRRGKTVGSGVGTRRSSFFDLFRNKQDPNNTVEVNKYLWQASLEVLNFLPIESVDPFSGVIVTGYGTPPGGGRAYRATIYVQDPALDARSLKVALLTRGGPVDAATQRAVEDAILTRARQLRIRDSKL